MFRKWTPGKCKRFSQIEIINILRGTHVVVLGALAAVGSGPPLPPLPPPLPLPRPSPPPPPSWSSASSPASPPSPHIHASFVLPLRLPGPVFMISVLSRPPGPTFLALGPTLFPLLGLVGRRKGTRTGLFVVGVPSILEFDSSSSSSSSL